MERRVEVRVRHIGHRPDRGKHFLGSYAVFPSVSHRYIRSMVQDTCLLMHESGSRRCPAPKSADHSAVRILESK